MDLQSRHEGMQKHYCLIHSQYRMSETEKNLSREGEFSTDVLYATITSINVYLP